ncbi:mitotic cohesin complex [Histoplasma capsulatum G186AR]|uniref:Mitotic cohesin complex n=2 Tax=Ajellomyces capsulatus TaxID=5037 RepID=C0NLV8_AJECG|nr:mitotic cohesin complex [Histoplasma capsulatum G186AR]EEH07609.1 mitotic cohesin complex [Histoplasma capsulatum G186AR]KAG5304253.1 mitotic cohesin complex [Histoplasma capsulatum]QSS69851.1 mitotic cohesin complex [Histoplasma capsulatum G186AR]
MNASAQGDERDSSSLTDPGENARSPRADTSSRRKSGRAKRKPELFSSTAYTSSRPSHGGRTTKRKRAAQQEDGDEDENDASDGGAEAVEEREEEEEEDEDEEEDEQEESESDVPDEEELMELRKAARKKAAAKKMKKASKESKEPRKPPTKRTAKKPKITNGLTTELTIRPAVNGNRPMSKFKKPRTRPSDFAEEDGLYAEVFARGHTTDAVAAEWLTKYEQHNIKGMTDLVNFILRCTGTDLKVDDHDIEDVDNVASRLNDLQEEYQAQNITEYPLISKSKKFKSFQYTLTSFFSSLIRTIHSSSVLYSDSALVENIQVWVTSMSSAPIRPFRHTATIISLAIVTTLCNVAREVSLTVSNTRKQLDTEKRKKSVNKGRADAMQSKVQEGEKKLQAIDSYLGDSFDTVFVHRYRDVDPKIRAECVNALGVWISTYREMFFDGQYLRYLGWVLSDTVSHTRSAVVKQLHRLYQNKDNIAGLRAFTERFRPRIVEMAARDAEPGVRADVVELLDLIREAGLLEPDDIDSVGRLVFDSVPRVRKAAGRFFVENIQDVYDALTESLEEELHETFMEDDGEDNFETPRPSWIKYKCLVDVLQVYDGQESAVPADQDLSISRTSFTGRVDSRFVLATEAIYSHFEELQQWEHLAGYLLYDHSQIPETSTDDDSATTVKQLYKLSEGQEGILLEVLSCAVKLHIMDVAKSDTDKKGRKTKLLVERMEERQESIAHSLSQIIPQLLNKFGSTPEAASAILKLEHLVDLNLIQDLQKDAAAYSDLIGNINKQFLTHSQQSVLAEATIAFLHARTSDELREAMESKVQELWDDTIEVLRTLSVTKGKEELPSLSASVLTALSNTVMRISNLASVSDCSSILESEPRAPSKKQKLSMEPPIDIILNLSKRGLRAEDSDEEIERLEFELVTNSFKTLLIYFMWKVRFIRTALASGDSSIDTDFCDSLSARRDAFVAILTSTMQGRSGLDELRVSATFTLLDLQTVFGTLRTSGSRAQSKKNTVASLNDEVILQIQSLVQEIVPETRALISRLHDKVERTFAKKSRRKLEVAEVADDDEPMDSSSDNSTSPSDGDDDEDEADEEIRDILAAHRVRNVLLAEQKLCQLTGKMVLAIVGGVLDVSGRQGGKLKQKLLRNKNRLGQNYKEVVAFLDVGKAGGKRVASATDNMRLQPEQIEINGSGPSGARLKKDNGKMKLAETAEDHDGDEDEMARVEEDEEGDLVARELIDDEEDRLGMGESDQDLEPTPAPDEIDDVMGD